MAKCPTLCPHDLFNHEGAGKSCHWTCVRTRPNWDKRFARWLFGRNYNFFMPTIERETHSGGKRRRTQLPLMPGYVFVAGDHTKRTFVDSNSVVRILKPKTSDGVDNLHRQLWQLWKALATTSHLELAEPLKPGQKIRIVTGPLKGVIGYFQDWKNKHILVLQVDMLGSKAAFEIPESCATVTAE